MLAEIARVSCVWFDLVYVVVLGDVVVVVGYVCCCCACLCKGDLLVL